MTSSEPEAVQAAGPRRATTWAIDVCLGLLVAATTMPIDQFMRYFTVDDSWLAGLYEGRHRGFAWGSDLVFTYGPLGFVAEPRFVHPGLGYASLAFNLLAVAAIAVGLARTWRRVLHPVAAWALTYLIANVVTWNVDVLLLAALALVLAFAVSEQGRPWRSITAIATAAAVGVAALVKLSLVPIGGALALSIAVMVPRPARWRTVAYASVVGLLAFVLAWLALGQPLSSLDAYLRSSTAVIAGYSQAMGTEEPGRAWEYPAALVLAVATLAVARARLRGDGDQGRAVPIAGLALVAIAIVAAFRLGFVRHDKHSATFFSGVVVLLAALPPLLDGWRHRAVATHAVVLVVATAVLWQVADLTSDVVLGGPGRALDLPSAARDASDPEQIAAMTDAALEIGMEPEMLERIGDDTVHIDPQDTSLAVLTGMNWQPVPVFQSYVAYTPHLDRLNAEAIVESGPTWILRQPDRAIDGRNPAWESPLYQLAVVCNYDIELEALAFQLLGRRDSSRCGEEQPLDGPVGGDGQPVAVPDAPASDDLVLVRVECEPIRFERILGVLFKPRHQVWATTDAGRFRLVPAHLDSPLIVRSRDIQVDQLHVIGCGSDPTYEFTTRRW